MGARDVKGEGGSAPEERSGVGVGSALGLGGGAEEDCDEFAPEKRLAPEFQRERGEEEGAGGEGVGEKSAAGGSGGGAG